MADSRFAPLRKAVIPVAGLGTRFLPATKALPKEMLPVVDKPAIQYVVEEAVAAGLTDLLMITGRAKTSLEDHFDRRPDLEQTLESKGDYSRAALVQEPASLGRVHYVRQGQALGLGHAVLQASEHVGDNPFAVLLGDDLVDVDNPVLPRMAEVREQFGGSVLLLMEVSDEQIGAYGCAAVEPTDADDVVRVTGLVEKPLPGMAPSNLAVIGRYVLDPVVFATLQDTQPGRGGEIQLTDALEQLIDPDQPGGGMHAVVFTGRRYDTGDKLSYLKAVIELALRRSDLGPPLRAWLQELDV
ncbi:MAG: UTP--glucose-phosphate uridylyltransferase [Actinomycetota bacterium]|jgi:UTP--glucose-1-phosphate uridylyltransferase